MSQKQQTLKKLAKVAYIIAKIMRITMFIAVGVLFASLVLILLTGSTQSLDIEGVTISSGVVTDSELSYEAIARLLSSGTAYAVIIAIVMYYLGAIFKSIANDGSPFDPVNVSRLKKSAVCVALLSIIPAIVELSVAAALGAIGQISLFSDGSFLLLAFFFFCLAYIFEYGAELQKQSDETL